MQKFKLVTEQIGQSLKTLKRQRNEELKEIKQFYQQLQNKQKSPFDPTLDRIIKNLTHFKQTQYKSSIGTINSDNIVKKYDGKMMKIVEQIAKLDKVIKNGCGNIVEKPFSSRSKINSQISEPKQLSQLEVMQSKLEEKDHKN